MELSNFGAVLTFAIDLEAADNEFYLSAAQNPALEKYRSAFEEMAAALKKNEKDLLRARRENVTEMILEPIHDFDAEPFSSDRSTAGQGAAEAVIGAAAGIEAKAVGFYMLATEKMRAMPEVGRLLARLAKSRAANRIRLEGLVH